MIKSTHQGNWALTLRVASALRSALPGFGIHPWEIGTISRTKNANVNAENSQKGWEHAWALCADKLRAQLIAEPKSFVGECGLDHVAKCRFSGQVEKSKQRLAFETQLKLACELQRPGEFSILIFVVEEIDREKPK